MQKIFSTRLEEATLHELERATRKLGISKRQFLEEAIRLRAQEIHRSAAEDVWAETLGTWKRSETPAATIRRARRAFRRTFARHSRSAHARVRR
jgi:hypothetical protein